MTRHHRRLALLRGGGPLQHPPRHQGPRAAPAVTPTDLVGCKRVMLTDDWYPALARPNVELVTEGIAAITPDGVRPATARAPGRRDRPRHRLQEPRVRRADGDHRPRRPHARRRVGARRARLPRRHRARLPEPVPALRAQHQRRHRLGGLDDRVLDRARARGAARARPARRVDDRGPARGRRRLQRLGARGAGGHRLALGLHELVRRRARQRPSQLALDLARVPPPHGELDPMPTR